MLKKILFCSTPEKVARKSPCPVLTIRLPGRPFSMQQREISSPERAEGDKSLC
jgi:hypothetical protein